MIERRIKELSIALEALSRINGERATTFAEAVGDLLQDAINEARTPLRSVADIIDEHVNKPYVAPARQPGDDEIPF